MLAVCLVGFLLIRHYQGLWQPWQAQLAEAQQIVETYFVGEYDEQELADSTLAGYIAGLGDQYSYYLTEEEYADYLQTLSNTLVGVGITVSQDDGACGWWTWWKTPPPSRPAFCPATR